MKNNNLIAYIVLALALVFMALPANGLAQNLSQSTESSARAEIGNENLFIPLVANGIMATGTESSNASEPRLLDVTSPNVDLRIIDQNFGICNQYGQTKQFYHFKDQNAVIYTSFSYSDIRFEPTISVNLFAQDASTEQIEWWINNQYSDAIDGEAPEPIYVKTLEKAEYTLNEVSYIERVAGSHGQEYADYAVSYTVSDLSVANQFQLAKFDQDVTVHIRTKDCFVAQYEQRERLLDVSSEDAEQFSIDHYFSVCQYGPTQQFFTFGDQNAVMVARFEIEDPHFVPDLKIYLFSPELSAEQIDKWINNQHSDVIYPGAPKPIYTKSIYTNNYSITNSEFIDHTVSSNDNEYGNYGGEYDNYRVQYSVGDITDEGNFQLTGFDAETVVHILTRGCAMEQPDQQERVLDMSNETVELFTIDDDGFFSFCRYGPTQQFFTFGDQSAVMRVLFSTERPDFRPAISINLFEPELSADDIARWINNQHSDGIDSGAPEPIYTTLIAQNNYSITNSEFIDNTVGNEGDEYDNYSVQYSVSDVTDAGNFELTGFDQEALVHLRLGTKVCIEF